jgi:pimeloyl-ACP methyl ester carboxylesterase
MDERRRVITEEAVQFGTPPSLVGIVTSASPANRNKPGVILLNPGIVHRVGPGRIYVKIARALAAQGFTVFRFDFSGIGDSSVRLDNLRFEESSVDEACAAMSFLEATKGINRFILLGGCSGAVVSLETARSDCRAVGAILINFQARADDEEQAINRKDRHYYLNFALLSLKSWSKLLTGQSDYRKVGRALAQGLKSKFVHRPSASGSDQRFRRILQESSDLGTQLTFICSKGDPLLQDLREAGGGELKRLRVQGKVACDVIPGSDHTFSSLYDQERLIDVILKRAHAAALNPEPEAQVHAIGSNPVEGLQQRQSIP